MLQGTHLSTVTSEMYERRWERFYVRRPARIMAVRPGLSGVVMRSASVLDISRGGAGLEMDTVTGLGSHYYLEVLGIISRIGCAEVYRKGNRSGVKFIMPLSEQLLQRIIRHDFLMGGQAGDLGKTNQPGMGLLAR
ncbi:PilZ domain-containing protein [Allorhizobium sp. BGMRC 0089]|uniref:PilZ domain-containing protein n=1 Tax=Allorhizobium sonneratiae TaxID=2934936 RepID=UPI002033CE70|nr:PilZ domain-containing protein [Allorhizobium sonneratiae]MCM2291964.1 PilZ domain-containing protein [Allorhizobium sonneratiae]